MNAFVIEPGKKRRIFFALWPSEEQRQKIDSTVKPFRSKLAGTWTDRDNWHVTLVFIGAFLEDDISALQAAANNIACPSIDVKFERIFYWKRPKIICLFSSYVPSELLSLVRSVESAAETFGFKPESRPFRAHMTVARKAKFFEPITLAQPLELHWSSFDLIESVSIPGGVRYTPLKQ